MSHGVPEVLDLVEVPIPVPAADQVVVRVKAAGVNPIDWKLYSGSFHAIDDKYRDEAGVGADALPRIGLECAGVVTAVGEERGEVSIGDEVIVYPVTGAYADYVVANPGSLISKPKLVDWPAAGALMLTGTTAAHTLHAAGVRPADRVLIHGGSGGVGLMAVQLAADLGATVIATASEANHELLRGLGARPVTYGPGLIDRVRAAAPEGIDAALDLIGTDEALDTSLELVGNPDRVASIAGGPRRAEQGLKVIGNQPGADLGTEIRAAARPQLVEKLVQGRLRVVIAGTYPLEKAAEAHRAGIVGHAPGKLVLLP
ncbi:NADP-dependent oxidoreductase [Actinoplanes sp. NPDC049265]|uniref:NADP-dependent oxidoreductase n=1 Tax=Actinoplanes sp. NPDC049265 TaxID=3363902 RepID=UPI003722B3BD